MNPARRLLHSTRTVLRTEGLFGFLTRVRIRLRTDGLHGFMRHMRAHFAKPDSEFDPVVLEAQARPVTLADCANPAVSIVVPVHNQSLFTFNCLQSIAANTAGVPYEVIVVDDGSTDDTAAVLAHVRHVRVVRNEKNVGFVGACNAGAAAARGALLVFLNNDTVVMPGWLTALRATFERDDRCGVVGPRVVYPDGTLQEAGGIVWRDGQAWNYGKGDDPGKPDYNYVRDVDYVSGCALMVRRALFEQLGGFDARYAPGYWEDVDLCFGARAAGFAVRYQPAAVVAHFEGKTAGRDTTRNMKRHQVVNAEVFRTKWAGALERQAVFGDFFRGSDRTRGRAVLVLDHSVPMFDKDAGSLFMFSLLRELRAQGARVVFWPHNRYRMPRYCDELQQLGIDVRYGDEPLKHYLRRHGSAFDAAFVYRTHVAEAHLAEIKEHVRRAVYMLCDLESLREERRLSLEGGGRTGLQAFERAESELLQLADHIVVHSPAERDVIRESAPGTITVLPLPVSADAPSAAPFDARSGLLFVGSIHPPNVDAITNFVEMVLPRLNGSLGDARLTVAGEVGRLIDRLAGGNVRILGHVPSLQPLYEEARVFVAPLRYGAGLKGKILEALARGIPLVTTTIGAEGIGLEHGVTAMIADDDAAFAEAVARLYNEPGLWDRMRANALALVEREFSSVRFQARVAGLVDQVCAPAGASPSSAQELAHSNR